MIISRSIHVAANGIISLFLWLSNTIYCIHTYNISIVYMFGQTFYSVVVKPLTPEPGCLGSNPSSATCWLCNCGRAPWPLCASVPSSQRGTPQVPMFGGWCEDYEQEHRSGGWHRTLLAKRELCSSHVPSLLWTVNQLSVAIRLHPSGGSSEHVALPHSSGNLRL